MKKIVSFLLALALVLTGATVAFGATPLDVTGTPYETAVNGLMEKGVVVGYPDGTYRPTASINRAEACVIVIKSMGATEADLAAAAKSGFSDLVGFDWATKYINYAVTNDVISGYADGTFRPNSNVTYNEMAAMLVRALGFQESDLTGTWPSNFVTKAEVLGIFSGIAYQGNAAAIRGHVAMMDYRVATSLNQVVQPIPADPVNPAGALANYSGRAFGIILDKASVLNEEGDVVEQIEFLFGDDILYLNTDGKCTVDLEYKSPYLNEGFLSGVKMRNGVVTAVAYGESAENFASSPVGAVSSFEHHDLSSWGQVQDSNGDVIKVTISGGDLYKAIIDNASVYVATIEKVNGNDAITGYTAGDLSDIDEGTYVRLYTITGDNPGVVEVVLVSEKQMNFDR